MKNLNTVKEYLSNQGEGLLALDIDETLSNTILAWVIQMQEIFGNPEGLNAHEIVARYKHSSNIPYWQEQEHLEWQKQQINCNEMQKGLPLIDFAKEIVEEINKVKKVGLYITVRPQSVLDGSYEWLKKHNFPNVPIYARPENIGHQDGNKWKAEVLQELYPYIDSIVDDNPKLSLHLPKSYKGKQYLYGHDSIEKQKIHTIPCKTWQDVLEEIKKQ